MTVLKQLSSPLQIVSHPHLPLSPAFLPRSQANTPIVKAYSYLGQAQLALNHPSEALHSSMTAYELAITQRSPSVASIAAACLDAKKKRWEQREEKRRERECQLMLKMTDIIERDADRAVDELLKKGRMNNGNINISEQEEEIRHEAKERVRTLEDVFGKAEAVRCARREVPDYLIDNITFSIMLDPVIVSSPYFLGLFPVIYINSTAK